VENTFTMFCFCGLVANCSFRNIATEVKYYGLILGKPVFLGGEQVGVGKSACVVYGVIDGDAVRARDQRCAL